MCKHHAFVAASPNWLNDPRRPGQSMLRYLCLCGRASLLTPGEMQRKADAGAHLCPSADCGKGSE